MPAQSLPCVQLVAALDEVDGIEVEHALGLLVIAHAGVIAGEAQDARDPQERRRKQVRLQGQAVAVAAGHLEDGVAAPGDDLVADGERAQAHDRALVVGDVEAVDLVLEEIDVVEHRADVGALGRADLAGDDEPAALRRLRGRCSWLLRSGCLLGGLLFHRGHAPGTRHDVPIFGRMDAGEFVFAPLFL